MHMHLATDRGSTKSFQSRPWARTLSLGVLIIVAVALIASMVALWPNYDKVREIVAGNSQSLDTQVIERGEILGLEDSCDLGESNPNSPTLSDADQAGAQHACVGATVGILSGEDAGHTTNLVIRGSLAASGLKVGDKVELAGVPAHDPDTRSQTYEYSVSGIPRGLPLSVLALVFIAVLLIVGRLRGLLALFALTLSAGVLFLFVLPALLTGANGLIIGVVASAAIMFVTLYFVHGPTLKTTAALIGTLAGIAIVACISWLSVSLTRFSGIGDESAGTLSTIATDLDFRGLLSCAILIAGLGVLNDVTISQASAVWELREAAPTITRAEVFSRAMRIGRDHIASTVYTVFFAYVGAALSTLLVMYIYNRPVLMTLSVEEFATEVVRTLVGSIGLILAVPITTWVATLFIPTETDRVHTPQS